VEYERELCVYGKASPVIATYMHRTEQKKPEMCCFPPLSQLWLIQSFTSILDVKGANRLVQALDELSACLQLLISDAFRCERNAAIHWSWMGCMLVHTSSLFRWYKYTPLGRRTGIHPASFSPLVYQGTGRYHNSSRLYFSVTISLAPRCEVQ